MLHAPHGVAWTWRTGKWSWRIRRSFYEFTGNSAFAPLNPDLSVMCVPTTEYPSALDGAMGPNYLARIQTDLKTMVCASTAGCTLVTTPCP
jgi:hypothetical protein